MCLIYILNIYSLMVEKQEKRKACLKLNQVRRKINYIMTRDNMLRNNFANCKIGDVNEKTNYY